MVQKVPRAKEVPFDMSQESQYSFPPIAVTADSTPIAALPNQLTLQITLQNSPPNLVTENTDPSCEEAEEEEMPPETNQQIYKSV